MTLAEELAKKWVEKLRSDEDTYLWVSEHMCGGTVRVDGVIPIVDMMQDAINEALERCEMAVREERVEEVGPGDDAYNMALDHSVAAIRALKG